MTRPSRPLAERFWPKVNKHGPLPSAEAVVAHPEIKGHRCWIYGSESGAKYKYKTILVADGQQAPVHRVAWFLETGKWPELWLLHKCDRGACVRLSHLFEGTPKDSARDMVSRRAHYRREPRQPEPEESITSVSVSMITSSTAYVTPPITTFAIKLANLLPGDIEELPYFHAAAPYFHTAAAEKETPAEAAAFERFLDENFPANNAKFAAFRRFIDNPQWELESRLFTYRVLTETRRQLRATAYLNKLIALQEGHAVPPLRICEYCGLLFIAKRKDALTCSETCSDGRRKRRWRAKAEQYELQRARTEYQRKERRAEKPKGARP